MSWGKGTATLLVYLMHIVEIPAPNIPIMFFFIPKQFFEGPYMGKIETNIGFVSVRGFCVIGSSVKVAFLP